MIMRLTNKKRKLITMLNGIQLESLFRQVVSSTYDVLPP